VSRAHVGLVRCRAGHQADPFSIRPSRCSAEVLARGRFECSTADAEAWRSRRARPVSHSASAIRST